jgi:AraC family transcriptional regulator of adaptative response/methylated-DNA-[protein]-cysteine methyltransferase
MLQGDPKNVLPDPLWAAVCARDTSFDDAFVYAVETTGVYCRPSCAARRPRRENVTFHPSWQAAERSGFRACKRCKPRDDAAALGARVAKLCRLIEQSEVPLTAKQLAGHIGLSESRMQRVFKSVAGLTPKAYADAHRGRRFRAELGRAKNITSAIQSAGFSSTSRVYEASRERLGMTPSDFRRGAEGVAICYAISRCSLGSVLVAMTARGVCAIFLGDDAKALEAELARRFSRAHIRRARKPIEQHIRAVVALVENPSRGADLPLDIQGTAFQERVWRALRNIPAGTTRTYSELARVIGAPRAVRAVASACGANELAVVIPCHRVVGKSGKLSGYRWGVERKRALLEREGQ